MKKLKVFLHPAFSDENAFAEQIKFFSEKYKVITVDLVGMVNHRIMETMLKLIRVGDIKKPKM